MNDRKMKAVVCPQYGPPQVLQIKNLDIPIPKRDEMLIEVRASAVTNSDIFIRGSQLPFPTILAFRLMMGIFKPRRPIMGLVFSGVVKSIGSDIQRFVPGDEVYGMTGFQLGAHGEYTCIKERDSTTGCVSIKPKNISFEEATSAVYGGSIALQFMDRGNIKKGQRILIYGASGTSGTLAVQYGKYLGAHVTAVCSGRNGELVKSLGADSLLDYTVTEALDAHVQFDFILDSVGKMKTSRLKEACKAALTKGGKYLTIDGERLELRSHRLDRITRLIEEGILKPIVDRIYPLEEIVEAHRYVETGHKRGGVAISIQKSLAQ